MEEKISAAKDGRIISDPPDLFGKDNAEED